MPDITLNSAHAAEFADLLGCLRDWIDLEQDQLDPLATKHGYDINGMRIGLDQLAALLTRNDDEPAY
ncbi:hypothetical protein [[Mycobacterium] zoologicum]|uniref:hypothetical protein n=1 Tax=[Mycobacterium] zoologicum TaxID=2872311 RepID=UPI002BD7847A|nr:hypothetical protein [Mycolicibacter sp. MYC101]MEB3065750.1 hypothetical protein [Mycolicibacter sp. MYC101]